MPVTKTLSQEIENALSFYMKYRNVIQKINDPAIKDPTFIDHLESYIKALRELKNLYDDKESIPPAEFEKKASHLFLQLRTEKRVPQIFPKIPIAFEEQIDKELIIHAEKIQNLKEERASLKKEKYLIIGLIKALSKAEITLNKEMSRKM